MDASQKQWADAGCDFGKVQSKNEQRGYVQLVHTRVVPAKVNGVDCNKPSLTHTTVPLGSQLLQFQSNRYQNTEVLHQVLYQVIRVTTVVENGSGITRNPKRSHKDTS